MWGVGRSESQETDPDSRRREGLRGRARVIATPSQRHRSHLLLGGARSGKSRQALALARAMGGLVGVVATAQAHDADLVVRIARHRAERPAEWPTIEEPVDLVGACRGLIGRVRGLLVDCVTLWAANRLLRGETDDQVLAAAEELGRFLAAGAVPIVLVSNEVGMGVHPATAEGLRFRDLLGQVNQRLAASCDDVTLMVAGLPVVVKGGRAAPVAVSRGPRDGRDDDTPVQAP